MGGRRRRLAAASALALGVGVLTAGPAAAADRTYTRTDTFRDCDVESRLTVQDSGTIEVSTRLVGPEVPCSREEVFVRVTYVDEDGDARSATAEGPASVRYSFSAPDATEVRSFHSTTFFESCFSGDEDCTSDEYELRAK